MATSYSPKIITDGLAFVYDTGDGKSYKGEPTINYIHGQNAVAKDSYSTYSATSSGTYNAKHPNAIVAYNAAGTQLSGYYNSGVTDATNTYHAHWQLDPILKKPVVVMNDVDAQWKAKSFGTGLGSWNSQSKSHGDTYTISWLQWVDHLSKNAKAGLYTKNTSGSNGFHDGQANSSSSYNTVLRTWQRVYQTYTTNSVRDLSQTLASIYMYGHYNVRATVKVADVQFTWGSHPVQFSAEYERSATQGLIDRTGNSTIDLSNASFDSNAQMVFDGTDDYISISDPEVSSSDGFSIELIIKPDNPTSSPAVIVPNSGGIDHWLRFNGNGQLYMRMIPAADSGGQNFLTSTYLSSGNYHHVVFTFKQSEGGKVYYNGALEYSNAATITALDWTSIWRIGQRGNNAWFLEGELPVLKVYNRTLTAAEALQNYNATKGRFGL